MGHRPGTTKGWCQNQWKEPDNATLIAKTEENLRKIVLEVR